MIIINYYKLKASMMDIGYQTHEAKEAIKKIRVMNKDLKKEFGMWYKKGIEPTIVIEGVTISNLEETCGMNKIKAFLFMDWLIRDPDLAKKALSKTVDVVIVTDEDRQALKEQLEKEGINVEDTNENTENIEIE